MKGEKRMNKKEKESNKEMCKCGHTRGQHSYVESFRCLQVMSCECKGFALEGGEE